MHVGERVRRKIHHDVDVARHQIVDCRAGAAIWHRAKACPSPVLERQADDVGKATRAAVALRGSIGILLQPSDQLGEVIRRHVFLRDDHELRARNQRDRREVPENIVRKRQNRTIENVRADAAEADRVAVRWRAGDAAGADAP